MALRTLGLALSRLSLAPALPRGVPATRAPLSTSAAMQSRLLPAVTLNASATCSSIPPRRTLVSASPHTLSLPSLVTGAMPACTGQPSLSLVRKLSTSEPLKASLQQMHRTGPVKKKRKNKNPLVTKAFARGVVLKTLIKKPRKPNSANRKCVLVRLSTGREMVGYIPGEGHNLQEHNIVLVRPGRLQDVPGVKVKCIRGKYDLQHVIKRKK
ncbi:40S ribosomal protein S12, mitochondrial-like [Penaeus japonicus]|uniref:40S ribosomal protein S12, mitochondrial-like n=1 Tax=Penaeus japonicus TaxID=27405 RepID=UPI001C70C370|nr:40S ribosomal protein S12, mitochondrial-like [Penaeus japonicus]XP_042868133.1 40S ribosomal protein S12, mitochondrial-like [Penaeus japonicus]